MCNQTSLMAMGMAMTEMSLLQTSSGAAAVPQCKSRLLKLASSVRLPCVL